MLALVGGVFLPPLETARRWGTLWDHPLAYVDDWAIALFLLTGAWATSPQRRRSGPAVLSAAWGFACGMVYSSIAAHWQAMSAGKLDPAPISTETVFAIKIVLGVLALAGLLLALAGSRAAPSRPESR
jgi:hypothetical protein